MSIEENKALIRRLVETFNKHNVALLDEFMAPDFVDERNTPFELRGRERYKEFEATFIKAFPDYSETIEEIIAEGDKVWILQKVTGTHTGEWNFLGVTFAPTDKKVIWTGVNIWRIVDGKVVERKSVRDLLVLLTHLGLIEPTEKGKKLFPQEE